MLNMNNNDGVIMFFRFREFLELDAELPKSNQTAALSGKNMMKVC